MQKKWKGNSGFKIKVKTTFTEKESAMNGKCFLRLCSVSVVVAWAVSKGENKSERK